MTQNDIKHYEKIVIEYMEAQGYEFDDTFEEGYVKHLYFIKGHHPIGVYFNFYTEYEAEDENIDYATLTASSLFNYAEMHQIVRAYDSKTINLLSDLMGNISDTEFIKSVQRNLKDVEDANKIIVKSTIKWLIKNIETEGDWFHRSGDLPYGEQLWNMAAEAGLESEFSDWTVKIGSQDLMSPELKELFVF